MGVFGYNSSAWKSYTASTVTSNKSTADLFSSRNMPDELNPKMITVREARDSVNHPASTPIIIALDVTGSMSPVLRSVLSTIQTLVDEVYKRNTISDPQICFMGVGDADYDEAPLQVTQFESDVTAVKQLQKIYLEQGGGGNDQESYILPWYFALNNVSADAIEKRSRKGILITLGDEGCPMKLTKSQVQKVFGTSLEEDLAAEDLLAAVSENWEVYHLVITQGNFYSARFRNHDGPQKIADTFGKILGERCILVKDYSKIPEIIVSILETLAGKDVDTICDSWDASTSLVVREAISGLTKKNESEVVMF